jgi:hypothetical protein
LIKRGAIIGEIGQKKERKKMTIAKDRLMYWLEICHRINIEIKEKKALRNLALERARKWRSMVDEENKK